MSQKQILQNYRVPCFPTYFIGFIYFFNFFCAARDIVTGVGINPITGTVCTLFGIPGAILLYAVRLYSFL